MKAILKKAEKGVEWTDVEKPAPGPDELLLRVRATSICGSDLHFYDWDDWAAATLRPPLVLGHEFCGEVMEDANGFKAGDLVAVESHIPCGDCVPCRNDERHICNNLKIIGVHRDGSFAEFVTIPALCAWKLPDGMSPEIGSIMEPMGCAVHAVTAAGVKGKRVAVMGCGPIGLFAVAAARAQGAAEVTAIDILPEKLEVARSMGAHEILDGGAELLLDQMADPDIVLEMSGNFIGIQNGLRGLRRGGTFVALGISSRPIELDLSNEVIMKGKKILGIHGRLMFSTWEEMQRLLDGGLDPSPVITHRFALDQFEKGIETLRAGSGKIVLSP